MAKKKKGPTIKKGLDDWMATYADMVTLLFCFFVMLYSAATMDEAKFQYILQSFRTDGRYINTIVGVEREITDASDLDGNEDIPTPGNPTTEDPGGNPPGVTQQQFIFESLFEALMEIQDESDLDGMMSVHATPGTIRIRLGSDILFAPDSYTLNPRGIEILRLIAAPIKATQEYVGWIQIQGHTAAVTGTLSFGTIDDWDLSSMRASETAKFLDHTMNMADSEKFRVEGFGQYHPIASNETNEGRAQNRRVEIVINRCPNLPKEVDRYIRDVMEYDYNQPHREIDAAGEEIREPGRPLGSIVDGIINELWDRYGDRQSHIYDPGQGGVAGPRPGDFGHLTDRDFIDDALLPDPDEEGDEADEE